MLNRLVKSSTPAVSPIGTPVKQSEFPPQDSLLDQPVKTIDTVDGSGQPVEQPKINHAPAEDPKKRKH